MNTKNELSSRKISGVNLSSEELILFPSPNFKSLQKPLPKISLAPIHAQVVDPTTQRSVRSKSKGQKSSIINFTPQGNWRDSSFDKSPFSSQGGLLKESGQASEVQETNAKPNEKRFDAPIRASYIKARAEKKLKSSDFSSKPVMNNNFLGKSPRDKIGIITANGRFTRMSKGNIQTPLRLDSIKGSFSNLGSVCEGIDASFSGQNRDNYSRLQVDCDILKIESKQLPKIEQPVRVEHSFRILKGLQKSGALEASGCSSQMSRVLKVKKPSIGSPTDYSKDEQNETFREMMTRINQGNEERTLRRKKKNMDEVVRLVESDYINEGEISNELEAQTTKRASKVGDHAKKHILQVLIDQKKKMGSKEMKHNVVEEKKEMRAPSSIIQENMCEETTEERPTSRKVVVKNNEKGSSSKEPTSVEEMHYFFVKFHQKSKQIMQQIE